MLEIRQVDQHAVDEIAPLFDAYRQFYAQMTDVDAAREFLRTRLGKAESVLFVARKDGVAVGFTQLYPSFSSVRLSRVWVLNDLFVADAGRRSGVGRALLREAVRFAKETGASHLELATGKQNTAARALYESDGWQRDDEYDHYEFSCAGPLPGSAPP